MIWLEDLEKLRLRQSIMSTRRKREVAAADFSISDFAVAAWVTLQLKLPLLSGAFFKNILCKENRKPSNKHQANLAGKAIFAAREPLLLPRQSSNENIF